MAGMAGSNPNAAKYGNLSFGPAVAPVSADIDALVAGLRRIDGDDALRSRLVDNGRLAFDAGFTTDDYVRGMIELYESVIRAR